MPPASPERSAALRLAIERFLQERLDTKLKPLPPDDPQRQALLGKYERRAWIDQAARRAHQIQLATHTLKATHPDARGTSLFRAPNDLHECEVVGTHCLPADFTYDVDGNAGALDVYALLRLSVDGRTLLELMLGGDSDIVTALSEDEHQARAWVASFSAIASPSEKPASHALAKQLYWLVGPEPRSQADYHLLAPLYASSLAQAVFLRIEQDLFDDLAVQARKSQKEGKYCESPLRIYSDLALQQIGGTSAKSRLNISSLNGARRGKNYLLASLPPLWEVNDLQAPLRIENAMHAFGRQREVRRLVRELAAFLKSDPDKTYETRDSRDDWTDQLIDELLHYGSLVQQSMEPGWTAAENCKLLDHQQLWLDPQRALEDEEFAKRWRSMQWVQGVYDDFAKWLNERLSKATGLPMGDPEDGHWAKEFKNEQEFLWQIDQMRRRMEKLEAMKGDLGGD